MISDDELRAIRERAEKATKGERRVSRGTPGSLFDVASQYSVGCKAVVYMFEETGGNTTVSNGTSKRPVHILCSDLSRVDDAEFIASLDPETVLRLLAEVAAARAEAAARERKPGQYEKKAERVRAALEGLTVEVEHLPREVYGPNLHVRGIEKAVRIIMAEFGYSKLRAAADARAAAGVGRVKHGD